MQRLISFQEFLDACANGNLNTVKLFVEKSHPDDICVNIRESNDNSMTGLMLAARHGHKHIIKEIIDLINKQATHDIANYIRPDLNTIDKLGMNALMYAAAAGHTDICQLLIESGCDPRNADTKGMTPAEYAKDGGHAEAMLYLFDAVNRFNALTVSINARKHYALYAAENQPTANVNRPVTRSQTKKRNPTNTK